MNHWIRRLYIAVLKDGRKVSEIIITRHGNIFSKVTKLPGDSSIQEWINKLQDNK